MPVSVREDGGHEGRERLSRCGRERLGRVLDPPQQHPMMLGHVVCASQVRVHAFARLTGAVPEAVGAVLVDGMEWVSLCSG